MFCGIAEDVLNTSLEEMLMARLRFRVQGLGFSLGLYIFTNTFTNTFRALLGPTCPTGAHLENSYALGLGFL